MKLNIKIVDPLFAALSLELPKAGSEQAAGLDLRACIGNTVTIQPGQVGFIGTGLAVEPVIGEAWELSIPVVGLVFVRSSVGAKKRLGLANGTGVIDQDYRGEIIMAIENKGSEPQMIAPGERIGQIVYFPIIRPSVALVEEFVVETARGSGGFGSTGKT